MGMGKGFPCCDPVTLCDVQFQVRPTIPPFTFQNPNGFRVAVHTNYELGLHIIVFEVLSLPWTTFPNLNAPFTKSFVLTSSPSVNPSILVFSRTIEARTEDGLGLEIILEIESSSTTHPSSPHIQLHRPIKVTFRDATTTRIFVWNEIKKLFQSISGDCPPAPGVTLATFSSTEYIAPMIYRDSVKTAKKFRISVTGIVDAVATGCDQYNGVFTADFVGSSLFGFNVDGWLGSGFFEDVVTNIGGTGQDAFVSVQLREPRFFHNLNPPLNLFPTFNFLASGTLRASYRNGPFFAQALLTKEFIESIDKSSPFDRDWSDYNDIFKSAGTGCDLANADIEIVAELG